MNFLPLGHLLKMFEVWTMMNYVHIKKKSELPLTSGIFTMKLPFDSPSKKVSGLQSVFMGLVMVQNGTSQLETMVVKRAIVSRFHFFNHPNLGFAGQFLKLLYVHNDVLSLNISSGSVWWIIYCLIIASICLLKCGPPIPSWFISLNAYSYINHSCDWSLFNQLRYYLPPLHCISWCPLLN